MGQITFPYGKHRHQADNLGNEAGLQINPINSLICENLLIRVLFNGRFCTTR